MRFFNSRGGLPLSHQSKKGFSLLEVLVSVAILAILLVSIYQSFSSSVFILSSTKNLWKSMAEAHNHLTGWERSKSAPISLAQGKFEDDHPLAGSSWEREISNSTWFGIVVRKVRYQIKWNEGNNEYTYEAQIYIDPPSG